MKKNKNKTKGHKKNQQKSKRCIKHNRIKGGTRRYNLISIMQTSLIGSDRKHCIN